MRSWLDALIALPFALLPRRRWQDWDLPIENVSLASSLLTGIGGAAFGITGYFSFMAAILAQREWTAPPMMILVFISYVFATPRGVIALYLTFSGFVRAVSWYTREPLGDPLLSLLDALASRTAASRRKHTARSAREKLEGAVEPDRRYDGTWAGLDGVDFVIVAARRKPGWTKGTWVITNDGWFTLGEPFDRPMPNGIRTIYPLILQTSTLDVLRKGVSYDLPPLRSTAQRHLAETRPPSGES